MHALFRSSLGCATYALLAGCAGPPAEPPAPIVRDSAGIEIVENARPLWAEGTGWSVADSARVVIGVEEGEEPYLLDRVSGATRLSDGRIVIANGGTSELRFFDAGGRHLFSTGRRGRGPGEFGRITHLVRRGGDTLEAWDWGLGPISRFDATGHYIDRIELDPDRVMAVLGPDRATEAVTPLPDGSFAVHVLLRGGAREQGVAPGVVYRPALGFFRFHRDGSTAGSRRIAASLRSFEPAPRVDSLGWYGGLSQMYLEIGGRPVHEVVAIPAYARLAAGGEPLRIFATDAERYEIDVFDEEGRRIRIIRRTDPRIPITPEELDRIRAARERAESGLGAHYRRVQDAMPPQTHYPAVRQLVVDSEGYLWVSGYGEGTHVFDPSGRWLGPVRGGVGALEIGRDYVLALERDSLMVERVKLYDLVRSPAAAQAAAEGATAARRR
jgi:hypothetical protein